MYDAAARGASVPRVGAIQAVDRYIGYKSKGRIRRGWSWSGAQNGSTRQRSSASTLPSLPSRTGDAAKYPAPPCRPSSPSQLAPSPPRPPDITLPAGTAGANSANHTSVPPHTQTASHPASDSGAARGVPGISTGTGRPLPPPAHSGSASQFRANLFVELFLLVKTYSRRLNYCTVGIFTVGIFRYIYCRYI